jgi:hypothetical protein
MTCWTLVSLRTQLRIVAHPCTSPCLCRCCAGQLVDTLYAGEVGYLAAQINVLLCLYVPPPLPLSRTLCL